MSLIAAPEGLTLTDGTMSLRADFGRMLGRIRKANLQQELLVRSVRVKGLDRPLRVLDATAGLGEDAFLLAAAGCRVLMYEQDPMIAALTEDALRRAGETGAQGDRPLVRSSCGSVLPQIAGRMCLIQGSSIEAMRAYAASSRDHQAYSDDEMQFLEPPDVIYLDPMFPGRSKSGLVKKKFQLLQQLERPCDNEAELLEVALGAGAAKIVIKRPLKGPFLAGRTPDYTLSGRVIRYDCILP